jgi:hypothetical protein
MSQKARALSTLGVMLIFLGLSTFIFNYERQSVDVSEITEGQVIVDYYAPLWDPLPHHVKVDVKTLAPVLITFKIISEHEKLESLALSAEKKTLDVYPGETIIIIVENSEATTGTVKTLLWCDSWNYAAAGLGLTGIIILFLSVSLNSRGKIE